MLACPWDVPTADWNTRAPKISKCTHCADRVDQPAPIAFNGQPLSGSEGQAVRRHHGDSRLRQGVPGRRPALRHAGRDAGARAQAHRRPARQVRQSRLRREGAGRDDACCTCRAVPFEKLGFPTYGEKPFPAFTTTALGAVPPAVMAVGAFLGAAYAFFRKRAQAVADGSAAAKHSAHHAHVEFEPLRHPLLTPFNWVLLLLMAFGARHVRRALRHGARRQHEPLRHLPVGPVDPLRPGVDRGGRGRVRDGRRDLRLPAKGPLRAGPHRRPDGPPELLLRDGHAPRRPRPALELLLSSPCRRRSTRPCSRSRGASASTSRSSCSSSCRFPSSAGDTSGPRRPCGDGTALTWQRR